MPKLLSIGYQVLRVAVVSDAGAAVNGEPVRSFRDEVDRVIVVTDNGNPDELVQRTAEAVDRAFIAEAAKAKTQARESSIEILHALQFRKVPIIPQSEQPRLPFGRPSEA